MKNITKALQEKYLNEVRTRKAKLSRFLKRRRIELGKTLEEVSEGICSTSYLSKIENCLVDVDESYFQMLFEKLNLEYKTVVEERKIPIYNELLKAYLANDLEYIEKCNNRVIESNSYSDTEIEIILILHNILTGAYEEVEKSIDRMDTIRNTLTSEELMFLGFLKIVFYKESCQYDIMCEEIDLILNNVPKEELLYFALLDIALDFYYWTFSKTKFMETLNEFKQSKYLRYLKKGELRHHFQKLLFLSTEEFKVAEVIEDEFQLIKDTLSSEDMPMYFYYYALHLTHKRKYEQAYLILNDLEKTSPIMALMGYLADKMYLLNYQEKYLKLLEEFDHTPFNPYNDYIEYIRLKFEQYSYNNLYNFLKNTVLEKNLIYKHYFLNHIELKEFYKIAFQLGKYKEIAKNILDIH